MPDPLEPILNKLEAALTAKQAVIAEKAKALGLEFIDENFQRQGWQGATFEPWQRRAKNKDPGRNLLVKSSHLRRSARGHVEGLTVVLEVGGPSMPYAQIHNEGGEIEHPGGDRTLSFRKTRAGNYRFTKPNGRYKVIAQRQAHIEPYTIYMPMRKYIGWSPILSNRIQKMMIKELLSEFK